MKGMKQRIKVRWALSQDAATEIPDTGDEA